jgi:hypothetical protein
MTVTVPPGGTLRAAGEKVRLEMEMKNPGLDDAGDGELESPHAAAMLVARRASPVFVFTRMRAPFTEVSASGPAR